MAEPEKKKISLNFKGLSKEDLAEIAQETLVSTRLPPAVADLPADRQMALLCDLARDIRDDKRALRARPDFARLITSKTCDEQYEAIVAMSPETNDFWKKVGEKQKVLKDIKFHLYMQSPDPDVRLRMMRDVDKLIAKEITPQSSGRVTTAFWHDLLYLSTFGGKMTRDRGDVYHIAYEFNAQAKDQPKYAIPWNPMETLFEAGLTKVYDAETTENNLTTAGKAVLVRLNELNGKPKAQRQYKQTTPAVQP